MKPWTEQEDALLRELYPDMSIHECAERLGRSYNSVQSRANKHLGLKSYVKPHVHKIKTFISRVDRDWRKLLEEIPEDTRTPGQKIMGEPLPGRSALDKQRAEARS